MSVSEAISELLNESAAIDPAAEATARMKWEDVPAKMAVYLLTDAGGAPMLLATVGDLRAALKRRLADTPAEQRSKRVEYGRLCTQVRFRVVHSAFAANWYYGRAVRLVFPGQYREMVSWRPTHFVAVDPRATHPRFRRVEDLDDPAQVYLGPIAERRAADKLVETVEDLFDLCRYHHILVQAPHGKACAYKEMGKCPAPCDGSISLEQYRGQIGEALAYLTAPEDAVGPRVGYRHWVAGQEAAMRGAAAKLEFERAGKIKAKLERGTFVEGEAFRRMDRLEHFAFLALQPGKGRPYVEPFFVHGGTIEQGEQVKKKDLAKAAEAWYLRARELAGKPVRPPLSVEQTEVVGLVAHHLFRGEEDAGVYLPVRYITGAEEILRAATALLERKNPPKPMAEQSSDRAEKEEAKTPVPEVGTGVEKTGAEGGA